MLEEGRERSPDSAELLERFKTNLNLRDSDLASITEPNLPIPERCTACTLRTHTPWKYLQLKNLKSLNMQSRRVMITSGDNEGEHVEISTSDPSKFYKINRSLVD